MASEGDGTSGRDANDSNDNGESEYGRAGPTFRRRGVLKLGAAAAATAAAPLAGLPAAVGTASAGDGVKLIRDPSPEQAEQGGGIHYDRKVRRRESDYVVETCGQLLDALDDADRGEIIYVPNYARIDLTGESYLQMDDGVTLASGRGLGPEGSPGGVIYADDHRKTLFRIYSDDVRVTGLRIRGPRFDYFDPGAGDYSKYETQGLWLLGENAEVDNCEIFGWPLAAVSAGSKNRTNAAHVHHNSIHNNAMEGYGYGVNLNNGHSLIEHNYFDMNRHSICGFGFATNGYEARYNVVGPKTVSHAFDMHGLDQNLRRGGNTAGGNIFVHHNTFQFTHDVLGRAQEAITIRGVPDDRIRVERNWFWHDEQPDGVDVGKNGQAYRQCNTGSDDWKNFHVEVNHFGAGSPIPCSTVGHPRVRATRPALAVDPDWEREERSGLRIEYSNGFEERLRITDVTIRPSSSKVAGLADGSWGEGRWRSEIHVKADVRNGTTDVGGGADLPASIDLGSDGHSKDASVEPILSGGSTAVCYVRDFVDRHDDPVDMVGERVTFRFDFRLGDGARCHDVFDVVPRTVR